MGIAAYNRGTKVIQRQCAEMDRPVEFALMDDLNAIPKKDGSRKPFGPIHFVRDPHRNIWWAECPVSGFGYWYRTLREAVSEWRVVVTEVRGMTFVGVPA